jgi:hypothetical protein
MKIKNFQELKKAVNTYGVLVVQFAELTEEIAVEIYKSADVYYFGNSFGTIALNENVSIYPLTAEIKK